MARPTITLVTTLGIATLLAVAGTRTARAQPAKEPPRSYQSPMRTQCEAELAKDKGWNAELRLSLRPEVHEEEASLITRNNKHVVMAYAAIWILTVGFVVLLWFRQRRLLAELDALEKKVAKAAEQ
jgi:CcmD family protein